MEPTSIVRVEGGISQICTGGLELGTPVTGIVKRKFDLAQTAMDFVQRGSVGVARLCQRGRAVKKFELVGEASGPEDVSAGAVRPWWRFSTSSMMQDGRRF